jgi:6-phosphogluconolactonase (cycloisomerase 2 family)
MTVHKSGRFVVGSNRGHDSLAVFKVRQKGPKRGELYPVGGGNGSNGKSVKNNYSWFHTRGETPRHFQFDNSGQYLSVVKQNSIWVNRNNNIFVNLDYEPKLELKNLQDLLPNIESN